MIPESLKTVSSNEIADLLYKNHSDLMGEFYEMQSKFLTSRYQIHKNIESTYISIFLARNLHLSIVRQREKHLDYDVSLKNFFDNANIVDQNSQKIISIVNATGIPKETVRRKLKKLVVKDFVEMDKKNKEYYWNLKYKRKTEFLKMIEIDIKSIARFVLAVTKFVNLNLNLKFIEEEIKQQFSFYFYHFYSCQLAWQKMWQTKIKDVDLIFIVIQALIPTLKYASKSGYVGPDNFHTLVGKTNNLYKLSSGTISASSISEISGIPRATCIRKLEKLVQLGMLVREIKTKRYFISQVLSDRTKHITKKENIIYTIQIFSEFLSTVISALTRNKSNKL